MAKRVRSGLPDQSCNQLPEIGVCHSDNRELRRSADIESAVPSIYQPLDKCKGILGRACIASRSLQGSSIGDAGDASKD